MSVPERVLFARHAVADLKKAEAALIGALGATDDYSVAEMVGTARKDVRKALRRAEAVLSDIDLRTAPQGSLPLDGATDANQGGHHGQ